MKKICLLAVFITATSQCYAQATFKLSKSSKIYNAQLVFDNCKSTYCQGEATIILTKKLDKSWKQSLVSESMTVEMEEKSGKPLENENELYGDQSALLFEDYNFDGTEDLAVRNGNNSGYGGPSYDVYVYNITRKKFMLSDELTELVSNNLGMFHTDQKRKRISTFNKSGCCWHMTTEYSVVPRKGLVKVYELEEDASKGDGEFVFVTERNLVAGKWKSSTKKHKITDYYKD